jgi:hypothetical protein
MVDDGGVEVGARRQGDAMKRFDIEIDKRLEDLIRSRGGVLTIGILYEMRG